MYKRFQFLAPAPEELAFSRQGKVLFPLSIVLWLISNIMNWPIPALKVGMGFFFSLFVIWLILRLGDIQRREFQLKYGFVDITNSDLRISLSERSLMSMQWHDFTGVEIKNGWLRFLHRDAQVEQGGQSKRLDRIRLNQLEDPNGLMQALSARIPPVISSTV